MLNRIFIATILVLTFASCNNRRTEENPKPATPKALENKSSSAEFISKRSNEDLIESLYNELVTQNNELKKLEDQVDELNNSKADSTQLFDDFNAKNQSYFSSADRHIATIKDSLLKGKMQNLLTNSLNNYNSSIARHNELLKIIETKSLLISDLHTMLKIVTTLPLIEKYQQDNLPATKPMEGYIRRQDETIRLADSISKK